MNRARLTAAFATAALLASPAGAAPQGPCLTEAEMGALITYMAPPVMRSAATTCAKVNGPGAFLSSPEGTALIARYDALGVAQWPQAKAALLKMGTGEDKATAKMMASISDQALRELMSAGFVAAVAEDIKVKDCGRIDRLTRSLAALPPEPVVQLITVLVGLTKAQPLNLCEGA